MSVAFKLGTLVVRTLAKPIAETIKSQAKEHAKFRKVCVGVAQGVHRLDVGMRLSLLRTEGSKREVRPLNESKAIDSGAKLISEAFLFGVAGGLIVFESWRSRRKENARREGVADAIEALQSEVEELRSLLEARTHNKELGMTTSAVAPARHNKGFRLSSITDPTALSILRPRYSDIVRETARKVRAGERAADL